MRTKMIHLYMDTLSPVKKYAKTAIHIKTVYPRRFPKDSGINIMATILQTVATADAHDLKAIILPL